MACVGKRFDCYLLRSRCLPKRQRFTVPALARCSSTSNRLDVKFDINLDYSSRSTQPWDKCPLPVPLPQLACGCTLHRSMHCVAHVTWHPNQKVSWTCSNLQFQNHPCPNCCCAHATYCRTSGTVTLWTTWIRCMWFQYIPASDAYMSSMVLWAQRARAQIRYAAKLEKSQVYPEQLNAASHVCGHPPTLTTSRPVYRIRLIYRSSHLNHYLPFIIHDRRIRHVFP